MSFASPLLLGTLLVPLLALVGYLWLERRPPRAVVIYPNVAVLAQVAERGRQRCSCSHSRLSAWGSPARA